MIFFQQLLLDPAHLQLESWTLDRSRGDLSLTVTSTQSLGICPLCQQASHRVHSRYCRSLQDLPCVGFALRLQLQVCKFFCLTLGCKRRIFTERLPQVAAPWARRTVRLAKHLVAIAVELGGKAGERLGTQLGYRIRDNTLLTLFARVPCPQSDRQPYWG